MLENFIIKVLLIIAGYLVGAIVQAGYWLGRFNKIDIREYGSGNAGTTNVMRTLGKKAGFFTYFLDTFKVIFCDIIIHFALVPYTDLPEMTLFLFCGLGVVLGHNFPFYLHFKGGKGIATSSGVIIGLCLFPKCCFLLTVFGVATFFIIMFTTKYVSLGSIVGMGLFFVEFLIWGLAGWLPVHGTDMAECCVLAFILSALAIYRHKGNIARLLAGTERKVGQKVSR